MLGYMWGFGHVVVMMMIGIYLVHMFALSIWNKLATCSSGTLWSPTATATATLQDYEWLEFFAGTGNLTHMMQATRYKSARFDLMDSQQQPHRKSNFMDMTHCSGFAFLGAFILSVNMYSPSRSWYVSMVVSQTWLNSLRLAILYLLRGKIDDFGVHFGLKCSSFCKMNVGTSVRSPVTAYGFDEFVSVAMGNQLLERIRLGWKTIITMIL